MCLQILNASGGSLLGIMRFVKLFHKSHGHVSVIAGTKLIQHTIQLCNCNAQNTRLSIFISSLSQCGRTTDICKNEAGAKTQQHQQATAEVLFYLRVFSCNCNSTYKTQGTTFLTNYNMHGQYEFAIIVCRADNKIRLFF